jgi:hypothetical protein
MFTIDSTVDIARPARQRSHRHHHGGRLPRGADLVAEAAWGGDE